MGFVITIAFAFLLINLVGCGRAGDKALSEQAGGSALGLEYVAGNNQSTFSGFLFDNELIVRAYAGGSGLPSFTIRFSEVTSTGATILTPMTVTTSDGYARTRVLPSPFYGQTIIIKAEVIGGDIGQFSSNFAPIYFELDAIQGAHHLELVQGDNQSAVVNQSTPVNPTIRVVDILGDTVKDWPVSFTVTSGGGSITTTQFSDENGLASVVWTMGTNSDLDNQLRVTALTISNPNTINFTADALPDVPSTITLSGGTPALSAGSCSAEYTLELRDQFNNISPTQILTTINLTDGSTGTFFSSSDCDPGNIITSLDINPGSYNGSFYYRSTTAGNYTLQADDTGAITAGTKNITINPGPVEHLSLIEGDGQSQIVDNYLTTLPKVRTEDVYGNGVPNVAVNWTTLTGGGSPDDNSVISDSSGFAAVNFKLGTSSGINTFKAENLELPGTPKTIIFSATGLADNPTEMNLTGPTSVTAGECAGPYTSQLIDQHGNNAQTGTNLSINLSGKSNGNFFSDSSCSGGNEISSIVINSGTSSSNYYYKNTTAEVVNLNIDDGNSLVDDTFSVSIIADIPNQISLTGPNVILTGSCTGQYTITILDQYGNNSPVGVNTVINLTGEGNGDFFSDSSCSLGNNISSITVNSSTSSSAFYYKNPIAESLTFNADDTGGLTADQINVYSDNGPPLDNTTNLQFFNEFSNTGENIIVSWTAFSDDDLVDHRLITYTDPVCSVIENDHGLTGSTTNSNSLIIDGLTDGVYYAKVIAIDGFGNSTASACSSDTITVDLTAPVDNGSDPQFNDLYDTDGNSVSVYWTSFSDTNIKDYELYTYIDSNCSSGEVNHGRTGNSNTLNNTLINSLSDGEYYLKIRAFDEAENSTFGNCSTDKLIVDLIDPTSPVVSNPPPGVTIPSLSVSWTDSTDTNFDTHNVKACTNNDCINGCVGEKTASTSPTSLTLVMNTSYFICVQGQDLAGRKSPWIASSTSVLAKNHPPNLVTITDQLGASEATPITTINAEDTSGGDTDQDGEAITYSCLYDTVINGSVSTGTNCTDITGITFNTTTGVLDWTPNYIQAGNYEFKITGTSFESLSDDEIFVITVANTDRPPVISPIADQSLAIENSAITTIDANDDNTGDDTDIDGDVLTYSCYYDTNVDGTVDAINNCTTIDGLSFSITTGILNWTPDFFQAGNYELKIQATSGPENLQAFEIFFISVANNDRPPEISNITDKVVNENVNIEVDPSDTSGGDTDIDNEAITYQCLFDNTNDESVSTGSLCTTLPGTNSFDSATGILSWTPSYDAFQNGPLYEIKITATSGPDNLTDEEIYLITVNNVDRPPQLNSIANQTGASENSAITTVDASDSNTSNDTDIDGDVLTYSCFYDLSIDSNVGASNSCISLSGVSFDTNLGVMNWTPDYNQVGNYEFKIIATGGPENLSDEVIFNIVVANTDRPPLLTEIPDQAGAIEGIAITEVNAQDSNTTNDTDIDGDIITYTCEFDNVESGNIVSGSDCSSLPGSATFDSATGVLNWVPSYFANQTSSTWEIRINGTAGPDNLSDDEFFVITVANSDRPPSLNIIGDQIVAEGSSISPVDATDASGGDTDIDNDILTYSCQFDTIASDSIVAGNDCLTLPGTVTFDSATGILNWTLGYFAFQNGPQYEIEITATGGPDNLSDGEIFVITATNVDRAPVLAAIGDQVVNENDAISTVNANDSFTGNDLDRDNDIITYSCFYDTAIDSAVSGSSNCSELSGTSFNASTGILDWTPGYFQSNTYEFKIVGNSNGLEDDEIFSVTVNNTDRPPELEVISNFSVSENTAISPVDASDSSTSSDNDIDNEAISYTCQFDTSVSGDIVSGSTCSSLPGTNSFDSATGILNWTPNFSSSGQYEIQITGTSGPDLLTDDTLFVITVNNTDRPPVLANISDQASASEGTPISQVDANDDFTGDDTDRDGDALSYTCFFDNTSDSNVSTSTPCTDLPGTATFDSALGVLNWTPGYFTAQTSSTWEIKIIATGGPDTLSDDEIFLITVSNTDRAPSLSGIGNQIVNEASPIAQINADDTSGGDTDIDNENITYSCYYDTSVDTTVLNSAACSTLAGVSFDINTGVMDWTPNYVQENTYEFKIIATVNALFDETIFTITVNNTDRPPAISPISDISVAENYAITPVDATDSNTSTDNDIDGDPITYTCLYDTLVSDSIVSGTACSSLPGVASFNSSTGILNWTPAFSTEGVYEVQITGTSGPETLNDSDIFTITVSNTDRPPEISPIADFAVDENSAISPIDASDTNTGNDTDIDGDVLTYSCQFDTTVSGTISSGQDCSSLPGSPSFNTSSGVFAWTPNFNANQLGPQYEIEITATGGPSTLSDTEIFVVTVNNVDRAPLIATINDFAGAENIAITPVDANDDNSGSDTDIDGDTLTYSCSYDVTVSGNIVSGTDCTSLPGVASFNILTGVLSWTPSFSATQDGPQYEIEITATGGPDVLSDSDIFIITVTNTDRPPIISTINDQAVNENSPITQINADDTSGGDTDIDGDSLTYSCLFDTTVNDSIVSGANCSTLPGTVVFDTNTGTLDWSPSFDANQNGPNYEIEITATGGPEILSDTEIFVITVSNVDRPPEIQTIGDQVVAENSSLSPIDANDTSGDDTDIDGDLITYSCVYDTVINSSVTSGSPCTNISGLNFNTTTGVLGWTPNYSQSGDYEFLITAFSQSLNDTEIFSVVVNNTDRPPVIATITDFAATENVAITPVNANDDNTGNDNDIDGDPLTYSCQFDNSVNDSIVSGSTCSSLPGTNNFDTGTGILSWTPNFNAASTPSYEIEITATGGPDNLVDTEIFVITVGNTDRAPLLSTIGDQVVNENTSISQIDSSDDNTGSDTDIDGDNLTYECFYDTDIDANVSQTTNCTTLTGINFVSSTGLLDWTPNYQQADTYEFMIVATGGPENLSDDEIFSITVNNVDRSPVIASIGNQVVNENSAISQVNADDTSGGDTDIDNEPIVFSCLFDNTNDSSMTSGTNCTSLPGTVSFNLSTGVLDWTPNYNAAATPTYEIQITATSGPDNLVDNEFFIITVANVDRSPTLAVIADQTISENTAISQVDADDTSGGDTDIDGDSLTYTCVYDNSDDGSVTSGTACTSLPGTASFNSSSGILDWTANYDAATTPLYEIKITATGGPESLSDDEIFTITVNNIDRTPILDSIADQGVFENSAISSIDANDTSGGDTDIDGDLLTYSCSYDNNNDGNIVSGSDCTTLPGAVSFNTTTGLFNWTPNYDAANTPIYEIEIEGTGGPDALSDNEIFVITVSNTDRSPLITTISDVATAAEGSPIVAIDANDFNTGNDTDIDGDTLTYSCTYDNTENDSVLSGTNCTSLPGTASFNTGTGVLSWTPSYDASSTPKYEIKIIATGGPDVLEDDEIFVITVNNTDRAPVLENISDQPGVSETTPIATINANDTSGGDLDIDGDSISYACLYDNTIDNAVASGTSCSTLGVTFSTITGVMDWTPSIVQAGNYEFKITGTASGLSDDEIFVITVGNTDQPPVLQAIGDQTVSENSAISSIYANDTSGGDSDVDGDSISYTCTYDSIIDGSVGSGSDCTTLTGVSFSTILGTLTWTPSYDQSGTYEFKIIGTATPLSDDEIFSITVTNVNRAPSLATISDQSGATENSAITQINANDSNTGNDTDIDGDTISYSCIYDNNIDSNVSGSTSCTTLSGLNFSTVTGIINWTPNFEQEGNYEFKITSTDGSLSSNIIFSISVANTNRSPLLTAISNQGSAAENSPITQINANDNNTGTDSDVDGDTISYSCLYDTSIDGTVESGTSCSTLTGVSLDGATGIFDWTPNYDQSGNYEFKIIGTDGSLNDDEIFSIVVSNTDRAPQLSAISNQVGVPENTPITTVDASDSNTGTDLDIDNDVITYTCTYDTSIDGSIAGSNNCASLSGVSFTASTGVLDWTPSFTQTGNYEFKITGTAGGLSDSKIFSITVSNVNRSPVLATITDQGSAAENTAIAQINANDDNTGNDTDIDGNIITYSCIYDNNINGSVAGSTNCSDITGLNFSSITGIINWTPNFDQAGNYEFQITGSDGGLSDDEVFTITVANTDRSPLIATISDQVNIPENSAITAIDANDDNTGNDNDIDGDAITYSCIYDTNIDGAISGSNSCSSLSGVSFASGTGTLNWTPSFEQAGNYEFKITGTAGSLSDDEVFSITVSNTNRSPLLATISNQAGASENTAIATINAFDNNTGTDFDIDNDAITYTCIYDTSINGSISGTTDCTTLSGLTFNSTTGVMDWTPNFTQSNTYEFQITGSDGTLSDDEIFSITVANTNRAPVLAIIPDQAGAAENTAITQVNANDVNTADDTDRDGDPITYSCFYDSSIDDSVSGSTNCTTITGLSFSAVTGIINWTPNYDQAGDYEFKITGSDGSLSDDEIFSIIVANTDRAPLIATISDQASVTENSPISTVDANDDNTGNDTDIDGDSITYSCLFDTNIDGTISGSNNCATLTGISFSSSSGIMSWTPSFDQTGDYEFKITGTAGGLSDDEFFSITVSNTNRAPLLSTITDQGGASENSAITTINANDDNTGTDFDIDNDAITYTCIYDTSINGSISVAENCTSLSGLAFNSGTGVLDWTPNFDQANTYEFQITGSDGTLSDDEIFSITVANTNRAPVLALISDQASAAENSAITQINTNDDNTGDDTDRDGDTITYTCLYDTNIDGSVPGSTSCTSLTGFNLNSSTGIIDWTPNFDQAGNYEFKITGSDGSLSDDELFSITVANTDRAPIIATISNQVGVPEDSAIATVDANDDNTGNDTDVDGDTITYSCIYDTNIDGAISGSNSCSTLTGVTFTPSTGIMDWTPSFDQTGNYEFEITATAGGLSDDEIFSITVTNTNRAPLLANIPDQASAAENTAINTINTYDSNTGSDFDIDGNAITYSCVYDLSIDSTVSGSTDCSTITGLSFNSSTGVIDWTPNFDQENTYEFKITGTDGSLSDDEIFSITVANTNRAPVLATISDQASAAENASITQINANDDNTGNDTDRDGDTITYTCVYDTAINDSVLTSTNCTTISGFTFNSSSGVIDWTPNYDQSGNYEFKITGSDGSLSGDEIFSIIVSNTDRSPALSTISNQPSAAENNPITQVNVNDSNTGDDTDIDGDVITYSCVYDTLIDNDVTASTNCITLAGVSFNSNTGILDWTPNYSQAGDYEFKVTGTSGSLSDDTIFSIVVANTNRSPLLANISNQLSASENSSITQVNARDDNTGTDFDIDNDPLTYTCVYDTSIDGIVTSSTSCTAITGLSFNTSSGVLDWTPNFDQSGNYELKITGSDGTLSNNEIFSIIVANTNRPPVLTTISNQNSAAENSPISEINANDTNTGNDLDRDGDTITYTCIYDTNIDSAVSGSTDCSTITGLSFISGTGIMNWTPDYDQSGNYEFKVTGSDGTLTDNVIFSIVVGNTNRSPVIATISDQSNINENSVITEVNANDDNTGNDTDIDGEVISYTCVYDTTIDGDVSTSTNCITLTGISFDSASGIINWTPSYTQEGDYEFKITGSDGSLSDDEVFSITVLNVNRSPLLSTISNQTGASENSAITTINVNDDNTGSDIDIDSDTINYSCIYDTSIDGLISGSTDCTTITGFSLNASSGVIDWTPNYDQAGNYEFKITGSDGSLSDDKIFTIIVENTNRAPLLTTIPNQGSAAENTAITQVNANDSNTGNDTDIDGETITYSCFYDNNIDGTVDSVTNCTSLSGINFNSTSGVIDWIPNYNQSGLYEFKIVASDGGLSDEEIFSITVANTNRPPVLAVIPNQASAAENTAITQVNANDSFTGNDNDRDGDAISYTCYYDTNINSSVIVTDNCTDISGLSFDSATGIMNWTPNYTQDGNYEFKIIGSDGSLSDEKVFSIIVANTNRSPILASISNQASVLENTAISQVDANDDNTGTDFDIDNEAITYSCYYDTDLNGSVASITSCSTVSGLSFNTTSGIMNWTPDYTQSGNYEFKITGTDGSLSADTIFTINVANVNRSPVLATITSQASASENTAITQIDANDLNTGNDTDQDGETITYTCFYDNFINGSVASSNNCTILTGINFNTSTGVMDWTPDYDQSGDYEFKINGSDGSLSDDKIFSISVSNTDRLPVLAEITNQVTSENGPITSIDASDANTENDTDIDGETITYTCYYDNSDDSNVANTNLCSSLAGSSFNTSTGVFTWTPDYSTNETSSIWEFKITGTAGIASDDEFFIITVNNTDRAPNLAPIGDSSVNENEAISSIDANDTSGGDTDADGDTITYSCVFDNASDGDVSSGTACSSLPGTNSFNTATGVLTWTPDYTAASTPQYEFKITGTSNSLTGDELFVITVTNVDRAPSLSTIGGQTVNENSAISQIDVNDTSTGNDTDFDGDAISYSCVFDNVDDGSVTAGSNCTTLPGTVSFNTSSGVLD